MLEDEGAELSEDEDGADDDIEDEVEETPKGKGKSKR
jgi:hypothetical protein